MPFLSKPFLPILAVAASDTQSASPLSPIGDIFDVALQKDTI